MADKKPDKVRRGFVAGVIATIVAPKAFDIACDVIFTPPMKGMVDALENSIRYYFDPTQAVLEKMDPIDAKHLEAIERLIGIQPNRLIKVAGGRDHYLFPNSMHHDNEWACNTVINTLKNISSNYSRDWEGNFDVTGSFVCCGSPTSNLRTARFLEYEWVDPAEPRLGFRRKPDARLKLNLQFELQTRLLQEKGLVAGATMDGDQTPEWGIRIGNEFLPTKAGQRDFMLISKLPNWIEAQRNSTFSTENSVTIFAGCHGTGTGALALLFKNGDLLDRLLEINANHRYWQALVGIREIGSKFHPIKKADRYQAVALESDLIAYSAVTVV